MTEKDCKIVWKGKGNPEYKGEGERVLDPKDAGELVRDMNRRHPDIKHEADCNPSEPPANTPTSDIIHSSKDSSMNIG